MNITPGPWHIGMVPGPFIYDKLGSQLADLSAKLVPDIETRANARAISLVPEMIEALRELLADKYLADPINADRMAKARAILNKLEG